jgi:hypothetical protein
VYLLLGVKKDMLIVKKGVKGAESLASSFKGLELSDESPPFKWERFSEPLDCPLDEKCKPESMVGTMSPLGGNP